MERMCGRDDLQQVHMRALDSLLGNRDLASQFQEGKLDTSYLPLVNRMTGYFAFAGAFQFKAGEQARLEKAIRSLRKDFICMHNLLANLQEQQVEDNQTASHLDLQSQLPSLALLQPLFSYLQAVIKQYLVGDGSQATNFKERQTAAIALLFHVFNTPADLQLNRTQCLRLLYAWQSCILEMYVDDTKAQADKSTRILGDLHPNLALAGFVHVRSGLAEGNRSSFQFPTSTSQEIKLCMSAINAVKLAACLSHQTIANLARASLDCVIAVTQGTAVRGFSFCELNQILVEMRTTWQKRVQKAETHEDDASFAQ